MPRVSRFWRQDRPWSFQTRCAYRLLLLIEFALTAAYLLFKLAYLLFAGGKLMPASRSGIAKKHPSLRTPASAFSSPGRFMTFSP